MSSREKKEYFLDRPIAKGQKLGQFELGSTILLFFPKELRLVKKFQTNDVLKYGQVLYESVRGSSLQ